MAGLWGERSRDGCCRRSPYRSRVESNLRKLCYGNLISLAKQHTTHTEVCQDAIVSKPPEVRTSFQLACHDDFCPTVVDSERVVCVAIERRGPTVVIPAVLHGHNEEETDSGYSTVPVCKRLACSCWDDRRSMHHFEVCSYRR